MNIDLVLIDNLYRVGRNQFRFWCVLSTTGSEPTVLFPVEFRYVAGDDIPLSPAYGRDSAFIAVHKYHRKSYQSYFDVCESIFDTHDGRPHWGKMHSLDTERLRSRYPEWDTFEEVRRSFDPDGAFLNDHLEDLFAL